MDVVEVAEVAVVLLVVVDRVAPVGETKADAVVIVAADAFSLFSTKAAAAAISQ